MAMLRGREKAWRETEEAGLRELGEELAVCFITTGKQYVLTCECDSAV